MYYETFPPGSQLDENIIFPKQTHSNRIMEVVTGDENVDMCDGLFTQNREFCLGIKTADCAPVVFIGKKKYGIAHAGWRGLITGILEKMLDAFIDDPLQKIWIGPLHTQFEIQRDDCHKQIKSRFGEKFFDESGGIVQFQFLDAVQSVLPSGSEFHGESTFENEKWASWRRQGDLSSGQNVTVVGNFINQNSQF